MYVDSGVPKEPFITCVSNFNSPTENEGITRSQADLKAVIWATVQDTDVDSHVVAK